MNIVLAAAFGSFLVVRTPNPGFTSYKPSNFEQVT